VLKYKPRYSLTLDSQHMNLGIDSPAREIATVLFMDIVGYSKKFNEDQADVLAILQATVQQSPEFQQAQRKKEQIPLPTGDGMAIVFLRDPVSSVKCALEIAASLKSHPEVELRMGINMGFVSRHVDIKEHVNVVGGGINLAQRVMDCGDAGHILLSQNVADVLGQIRGWEGSLKDLGMVEVKHGVRIGLYNLCKDGLGNSAIPHKVASQLSVHPLFRRKWAVGVAVFFVLLATGVFLYRRFTIERPNALKNPLLTLLSFPRDDSSIGFTLWRLRPSEPGDEPAVRSLIHEELKSQEWTPERISVDTQLHEGQKIMITIETARSGYLYVIDRDQYADGSSGMPFLIFPTERTRGGDNRVTKRMLIEIPSPGDTPPFFKVQRDSANQIGELLTILVTEEPIPDLEISHNRQQLPEDLVARWEKQWKAKVRRREIAGQAGKPLTLAEKEAGTRALRLAAEDPPPQTTYYVDAKRGDPLLIDVPLRIAR
jgi:class 3 adenylate cyclase